MDSKVFSVVCMLVILVSADDPKRDKRTVGLMLRGVADVFGYDVVRRVPGLPLRQMVTPKPTFFPPPVAPLPTGPYSRVILTLGSQPPVASPQPEPAAPPAPPANTVQHAAVFPLLIAHAPVMPIGAVFPVGQAPAMAPAAAPAMAPAPAPAAAPAPPPAAAPAAPPPAKAQAPAPAAAQAAAPAPAAPQQSTVTIEGPTKLTLFASPPRLAETVRRTLNFNLNWDRNVQPLGPAITAQVEATAVQLPASSAPQSQAVPPSAPAPAQPQAAAPPPSAPPQPSPQPSPKAAPPPEPPAPPPSSDAPQSEEAAPSKQSDSNSADQPADFKEYDYETDDSSDQQRNHRNPDYQEDSHQNSITRNAPKASYASSRRPEPPTHEFKQALIDFWKKSPWNSNSADSSDDERKQNYRDEPEQLSKYEEYGIEPVEQINVPKSDKNYRVRINVPLPEDNGYYEKEEFVKEETKSPGKVRKNVSNANRYDRRRKTVRSAVPTKTTYRRRNVNDLKTDRIRRVPAVNSRADHNGLKDVVQPKTMGASSKHLHDVYKREHTVPWPVSKEEEFDESEMKNYYKKWLNPIDRRTRNAQADSGYDDHYQPDSYNTDFSYTVPDRKLNYDSVLKANHNYDHEFPKSAKIYSKESGTKVTLVRRNKDSRNI